MKGIQKSIRMTDTVFETVNEYRGDGFNEKFENLVNDFIKKRGELEREITALQESRSAVYENMKKVRARWLKIEDVDFRMTPFVNSMLDVLKLDEGERH